MNVKYVLAMFEYRYVSLNAAVTSVSQADPAAAALLEQSQIRRFSVFHASTSNSHPTIEDLR